MKPVVAALCVALAAPLEQGLEVTADDKGWLKVHVDGRVVARGGLTCNGIQWKHTDQKQAVDVRRPGPGRVTGAFPLAEGNDGSIRFEQTLTPASGRPPDGRAVIDYEIAFEKDNEIKQQAAMVVLSDDVFAGRDLILYPSGTVVGLPRDGSRLRTEAFGWAVAVALDRDRVLLVSTPQPTLMTLIDFRQWGGRGFGVLFRTIGATKVPAGATARRRMVLRVTSPEQADRLASRWCPGFDRTKRSLVFDAPGRLWLRDRQRDVASAAIEVKGTHWATTTQDEMVGWSEGGLSRPDDPTLARRGIHGTIPVRGPGGTSLCFKQVIRETSAGLRIAYEFTCPRDCRLNSYHVNWRLGAEHYLGEQIVLTDPVVATTSATHATTRPTSQRTLQLPREPLEKPHVATHSANRVAVAPGHPLGFVLAFDRPIRVRIEDGRVDGGELFRLQMLLVRDKEGVQVPAGHRSALRMTLTPNAPHQIVLNDGAFAHRTDTSAWIPFTLPWDTTAVDLSFLNKRPAGAHGFLQARGDRFVFEDGTPARFWGTNFTAEQNLPPHRDAEVTARRLARYGVNMVRIHQADAGYAANNLFRSERRGDGTRRLDPDMLDRLDYLVAQLKASGIYVYVDLLSTRSFDASDGVAAAEKLPLGGKPYTNFDEHLIHLQEEFAAQLLTHVNPYTQRAYVDEPALAMIALVNENDVFSRDIEVEPYRTRCIEAYRAWAADNDIELPKGSIDLRHTTPELMRYLVHVQRAYTERMVKHLRGLGVRVPITGSNWTSNAGLLASLGAVDFTDSHAYWDHCWDGYTRVRNKVMSLSRRTIFARLAFQRLTGKPFFCSEWGQPWPNEFRAEMPLSVAAITALQGWGGGLIYTYAHRSDPHVDRLSGPFNTLNDPCLFGLFYHAALIVRRGDLARATTHLAVPLPDEAVYAKKPADPYRCRAYDLAAERSVLAGVLGKNAPHGWQALPRDRSVAPPNADRIVSDTGQYRRDWRRGIARIDSPRTQAAWGFLGRAGEQLQLSDLALEIDTPFAVVALSSLTDEPIRTSRRLLLTAVARAENTGMVYDLFHTRRIAEGHGPILVEPVRGRVTVKTGRPNLRVWALGPRGERVRLAPAVRQRDAVTIRLQPESSTMYFLIET